MVGAVHLGHRDGEVELARSRVDGRGLDRQGDPAVAGPAKVISVEQSGVDARLDEPVARQGLAGSPVVRDGDALVLGVMEFGEAEPEHYGPPGAFLAASCKQAVVVSDSH